MGGIPRFFALAGLVALTAPAVVGVAASGLLEGLAEESGLLRRRAFEFDRTYHVALGGTDYAITVRDAVLVQTPATVHFTIRADVVPAPSAELVDVVVEWALATSPVPVLAHRVEQDGSAFAVTALLPGFVMGYVTPEDEALLAPYEVASGR